MRSGEVLMQVGLFREVSEIAKVTFRDAKSRLINLHETSPRKPGRPLTPALSQREWEKQLARLRGGGRGRVAVDQLDQVVLELLDLAEARRGAEVVEEEAE